MVLPPTIVVDTESDFWRELWPLNVTDVVIVGDLGELVEVVATYKSGSSLVLGFGKKFKKAEAFLKVRAELKRT